MVPGYLGVSLRLLLDGCIYGAIGEDCDWLNSIRYMVMFHVKTERSALHFKTILE